MMFQFSDGEIWDLNITEDVYEDVEKINHCLNILSHFREIKLKSPGMPPPPHPKYVSSLVPPPLPPTQTLMCMCAVPGS